MQPASRKIDDIEMLRGFAMLLVLAGHANGLLFTWSTPLTERLYHYLHGASGVDLFFAISGFVIARDLHPRLRACTSFRTFMDVSTAFWIRRVWRIFPSAWLWLAIILIAAAFFNQSGAFRSFNAALDGTIAAIFQYYNYRFAMCHKHYDCGANFYYWTLSLEEQFYVLLPFAIFIFRKKLPYLLAGIILFQIAFPNRPPLLSVFRTDALLLGVLLALWQGQPSYAACQRWVFDRRWLCTLIIVILCVGMISDARIHRGSLGAFSYGIVAMLCAALVWIGSYDKHYLMATGPVKRVLMWIGSRSCSFYLAHIPVYYGTQELWFRMVPPGTVYDASYTVPFILTGTTLLLIFGELSYRFVESPSRRKGTDVATRFLARRRFSQ